MTGKRISRGEAIMIADQILLKCESFRDCKGEELTIVDDALDAIAAISGCAEWEYPGQVVRDVEGMKAEIDTLKYVLSRCRTVMIQHDENTCNDSCCYDFDEEVQMIGRALK